MAGIKTMNLRRSAMLGVALAALALPAAAMAQDAGADHGRHGYRDNGGEAAGQIGERPAGTWRQAAPAEARPDDGGQRRGGWAGRTAPEAQTAAAPVQAQARAQAQADSRAASGWRGRGDGSSGTMAGGWRGRGDPSVDAQAQARAQVEAQARAQAGNRGATAWGQRDRDNRGDAAARAAQGGWQGRNGTYTDPQRNGSYRDANRDGRSGSWNGGGDGYRDANRDQWRGNGSRYNGSSQSWNRDWRRDNRYNWSSYRSAHRSLFNLGVYYSPYRNYSYRRLDIGFFLDSLFYSDRYWIDDPYQYRLPEVYGPYRWVRYYDDALLVDIYSGEVVDVIHDVFW